MDNFCKVVLATALRTQELQVPVWSCRLTVHGEHDEYELVCERAVEENSWQWPPPS